MTLLPAFGSSELSRGNSYLCVHRQDNSIVSYRDTNSPRFTMDSAALKYIDKLIKQYNNYSLDEVFQVSVSKSVSLFSCRFRKEFPNHTEVVFFLENTDLKILSKTFTTIDETNIENNEAGFSPENHLIDGPILYFKNSLVNHSIQLVIKQRRHNGTTYNAVVDKYFNIETNRLEMKFLINIESKCLYPMNHCLIKRNFEGNKISSFLICTGQKDEFLGEVIIEYGKKYKIISKTIKHEEYANLLITGGFKKELSFLKMENGVE